MRPPMKPLKPLDEALAELLGHATPLTGVDTVTTEFMTQQLQNHPLYDPATGP